MTRSALPLRVTTAGFCLFALIGAVQALYGPVIPILIRTFALSEASGGLIVSAHYAGATAGVFAFGAAARYFSYKTLLLVSLSLLILGCLGLTRAPSWLFALGTTTLLGVGFGGLVAGINELFAYGFGRRSAAMLSLVNAAFGIGATLGPLLLALTGATGFRSAFLVCALLGLPLLVLLQSQPNWQGSAQARDAGGTPRFDLRPVLVFALVVFGYGLFESSVSAWQVTHLLGVGFNASVAYGLKASFWAAFMVGRLLTAAVSLRVTPRALVVGAFAALTLLTGAATVLPLAGVLYPLVGLLMAPIYTCSLAWFGQAVSSAPGSSAPIMGAGLAGNTVAPPLVGLWLGATSPALLPAALAVIALAGFGLTAFNRVSRPMAS